MQVGDLIDDEVQKKPPRTVSLLTAVIVGLLLLGLLAVVGFWPLVWIFLEGVFG